MHKSAIVGELGKGYKIAIGTLNAGRIGIGSQVRTGDADSRDILFSDDRPGAGGARSHDSVPEGAQAVWSTTMGLSGCRLLFPVS